MSIEAMKQVIELYDKHCYNNDYGGIEFNKKHGYKFIEAIEALRTAIQQAESEPCKSFTELRERHREGVDAELAAMAAEAKTYEPVGVPSLIEKAISSGYFGVLPMKATIPMCKAGWGASGGELTFQELGHIYEEMYKARPLLNDAPPPTHPAPGVPDAIESPVEDGTEYDYCSGRAAGYAEGWNACRDEMLTTIQAQKGQP